ARSTGFLHHGIENGWIAVVRSLSVASAAGSDDLRMDGAFHDDLGGNLNHPLLGEFGKLEGDIAFRPAGFDGLVRQSLASAFQALS
ncbi:hypothetical protein ACC754_40880, partial [Rhizobium johnstonii]